MIVERSLNEAFLSNTYLVAEGPGTPAAFVDAGGPLDPLLEAVDRHGVTVALLLLTHHHHDHVAELGALRERFPDAVAVAHPAEGIEGTVPPHSDLTLGALPVRALETPGHTAGMLAFVVTEAAGGAVFTGDTLFRDSVGGLHAPGHTTYADLKQSIMETILRLPPETRIYPGHTDASTVAEEWEGNAFVRMWRGLDPEGSERCRVWDRDATLVLWGDDYDGGHKAWIRWDDGSDDIVPGSQVQREG